MRYKLAAAITALLFIGGCSTKQPDDSFLQSDLDNLSDIGAQIAIPQASEASPQSLNTIHASIQSMFTEVYGKDSTQDIAIGLNTTKETNATHTGDVTGATALTIGADKVLESMLKAVNEPTDEYSLTYESTTGDFEWQLKQNPLIADTDYLTPGTASSTYAPVLGADDNYVTDTEKTNIGNLSSAAYRSAEDTLTDGANLPDGAAIKAYGDANWGSGGSALTIEEEGSALDTAVATIDFVGVMTATEPTDHNIQVSLSTDDVANSLSGKDIAPASVSVQANSLPTMAFSDSNSGNTNQTIATITANATTTTAGAVTSEVVIKNQVSGGDGVFHDVARFSGGDGISYIYDPLSAGIKESHATKSAAYTIGSSNWRECYGGVITVTAATTMTACSSPVYGMHFTVGVYGSYVVSVDPGDTEYAVSAGVALSAGDKITSNGSTGSETGWKYTGTYWKVISANEDDGTSWEDTN